MKNRAPTAVPLLFAMVAVLVTGPSARAEVSSIADPQAPAANGEVLAFTHDDATGITYFGGRFTSVSSLGGPSFAVDLVNGRPTPGWPSFTGGAVYVLTPDGAGGMYVGGSFTAVAGISRNHLAHLRADRSVDLGWNPAPNGGSIFAITVGPTSVYVAGDFSRIGGANRGMLAEVGLASGLATPWNPAPNGGVYQSGSGVAAILVNGSQVVVCGRFTSIGGAARNNLAALDVIGAATSWNPAPDGPINAMAQVGATLYVGGSFATVGGAARRSLAAVDLGTGVATAWNPVVAGDVVTLAVASGTVYAGGTFASVSGAPRGNLAAVTLAGALTPWAPVVDGPVGLTTVVSGTVYCSGRFAHANGASRSNLAAFDAQGTTTAWDPGVNNPANAITPSGSALIIGGDISRINIVARSHLAAIDRNGQTTPWNPGADSNVWAMGMIGGTVYFGGDFLSAGGLSRSHLAAATTDGVVTAWNPGADADIDSMATANGTVYVGGGFGIVGGLSRPHLAAINQAGVPTPWNPSANGYVNTLTASGGSIYAGGTFTAIGAAPRSCIAQLDAVTGAPTAWNPGASSPDSYHNGRVEGIVPLGGLIYVGGYFTTIGGQSRAHLAAIDANGNATAWDPNPTGGDSILCMSQLDGQLYVSGNLSAIAGADRIGTAAFDAAGNILPWNPRIGGYRMLGAEHCIYLGGAFNGTVNGVLDGYMAVFRPLTSFSVTASADVGPISVADTTFTFSFDHPVSDLTTAGIRVTNGSPGTLTNLGANAWRLQVHALAQGQVTVQVLDGAAHDAGGLPNSASNVATATYDSAPPTVTITKPTSGGTFTSISPAIIMNGTAADPSGISRMTYGLSGATSTTSDVAFQGGSNWGVVLPPLNPGTTVVTVTAYDGANNSASAALSVRILAPGDRIGSAVSLSGNEMAVLSQTSTSVYIRTGSSWSLQWSTPLHGDDVAIAGRFLAVAHSAGMNGAYSGSGVSLFAFNGTTWNPEGEIATAPSLGGPSVLHNAIALSGDTLAIGGGDPMTLATNGTVDLYQHRAAGGWAFYQRLTDWRADYAPPGLGVMQHRFGWSVAMNGDSLVVGAPGFSGFAYTRIGGFWVNQGQLLQPGIIPGQIDGQAGWSVAVEGDLAVVGDLGGGAKAFRRAAGAWTYDGVLFNSGFGTFSYALRIANQVVAVESIDVSPLSGGGGRVDFFTEPAPRTWQGTAAVTSLYTPTFSDGDLAAIAFDGSTLALGAPQTPDAAGNAVGAVEVYGPSGSGWALRTGVGATTGRSIDVGVARPGLGGVTGDAGSLGVSAGGTSLSGTADDFRFVPWSLAGDGTITAQVGFAGSQPLARVGLMMRESDAPGASYMLIALTGSNGLVVQRRTVTGGPTVSAAVAGAPTGPLWLRLARSGDTLTASYSLDGAAWTVAYASTFTFVRPYAAGAAVYGASATVPVLGGFTALMVAPAPFPSATPLHLAAHLGAVQLPGTGEEEHDGVITVAGGAGDQAGTSDQGEFLLSDPLAGDFDLSTLIQYQRGTNGNAKAGLTIRAGASGDEPDVFLGLTVSHGGQFQRRALQGGPTVSLPRTNNTAHWYRLTRVAGTITGSWSDDGLTWHALGTVALPGALRVGLAVSSGDPGVIGLSSFTNVTLTSPDLPLQSPRATN